MMLNTVTSAAPAQPAGNAPAPAGTQVVPVTADPAAGSAPAPAAAQSFALWFGQQADAGAAAVPAAGVPAAGVPAAGVPAAGVPALGVTALEPLQQGTASAAAGTQSVRTVTKADDAAADEAAPVSSAPDSTLLAAMAVPIMPLSPMQAAQALQAMIAMPDGAGKGSAARTTIIASATGDSGTTPATSVAAAGTRQDMTAAVHVAAQPAVPAAGDNVQAFAQAGMPNDKQGKQPGDQASAQPDARQSGGQDGQSDGRGAAIALSAVHSGQQPVQADAAITATRPSVRATGDSQDGSTAQVPAGTPGPSAIGTSAMASATAPAAPAADTVKLAGPPTAWRQSLQEALGERLNVQVGKNMEQAVIRLEPPQLGRIDIAIRHSAGTLEVNISASNGEVLRQLQTVSDNLRSDLSQRQFTEVAVTVAPAPKNAGTNPFGDPQQQGRGRQQGRDQESEPGRALAEAGNPSSAFSLDGRT